MHRFWTPIIESFLGAIEPKAIIEIGSEGAINTRNLLEYCKKNSYILHSIDPAPMFNHSELENEYRSCLVFHKDTSLNVLPEMDSADFVLIDGDHNWYTVYNELILLESTNTKSDKPFPVQRFEAAVSQSAVPSPPS